MGKNNKKANSIAKKKTKPTNSVSKHSKSSSSSRSKKNNRNDDISDDDDNYDDDDDVDINDDDDDDDNMDNDMDEDDEDDENDDDDDDDDAIKTLKTTKKGGLISKHKEELSSLEKTDPEFYAFLRDNDANLLDFGINEDDDEDDEDEEDDDREYKKVEKINVTKKLLKEIITQAVSEDSTEATTAGAIKKLLGIFSAACNPSTITSSDNDYTDNAEVDKNRYVITDTEVYEEVMIGVLDNAYKAIYRQLKLDYSTLSEDDLSSMTNNVQWKKMQIPILSFYKSILQTLTGIVECTGVQGEVAAYLLRSLEPYIPLLSPLLKLSKGVVNVLLTLWGNGPNIDDDKANVRGYAFLRIRQMALVLPGSMTEECFRSIYLSYARVCKSFNELSAPAVLFMAQSITELYTISIPQAYQQGFLYIRQLALHLRTASLKKTSDAIRQITSWQYVNCIRLWTKVISNMPSADELGGLAYPLTQIIFGVMATVPSLQFLPLRFHLLTCLYQLASSCQMFIPTAAKLLEVLEAPELTMKATPSTDAPPKLQYITKYPNDAVSKALVRDQIVQEVITLLRYDAEVYRFHVGLPEYLFLSIRKLKIFSKKCKITKWRDLSRTLAGQYEQYVAYSKKMRTQLNVAPRNITNFEAILPAGNINAKLRLTKLMSTKTDGILAAKKIVPPVSDKKLKKGEFVEAIRASKKAKKTHDKNNDDDDDDNDDDDDEDDEDDEDDDDDDDDGDDDDDDDDNDDEDNDNEDDDNDDQDDNIDESIMDNVRKMADKVSKLEDWSDDDE